VLLLGNVSLQDGVRLMDVALPARLAAALPGPPPAAWFRRERAGLPGALSPDLACPEHDHERKAAYKKLFLRHKKSFRDHGSVMG
jgi:hypothetical protein